MNVCLICICDYNAKTITHINVRYYTLYCQVADYIAHLEHLSPFNNELHQGIVFACKGSICE